MPEQVVLKLGLVRAHDDAIRADFLGILSDRLARDAGKDDNSRVLALSHALGDFLLCVLHHLFLMSFGKVIARKTGNRLHDVQRDDLSAFRAQEPRGFQSLYAVPVVQAQRHYDLLVHLSVLREAVERKGPEQRSRRPGPLQIKRCDKASS